MMKQKLNGDLCYHGNLYVYIGIPKAWCKRVYLGYQGDMY